MLEKYAAMSTARRDAKVVKLTNSLKKVEAEKKRRLLGPRRLGNLSSADALVRAQQECAQEILESAVQSALNVPSGLKQYCVLTPVFY